MKLEGKRGALAGFKRLNVTAVAAQTAKDLLAKQHLLADLSPGRGTQQTQEVRKVIDSPQSRSDIHDILRVGSRIDQLQEFAVDTIGAGLSGKQNIGNAHLISIGLCPKSEKAGLLGLPAKASDPDFTTAPIQNPGGPGR